ncbi:MAG: amidohydrolase [Alphaproteobacteria bacterium]|nr:amidohydrolase [Alphaproteobacteria bacterium]
MQIRQEIFDIATSAKLSHSNTTELRHDLHQFPAVAYHEVGAHDAITFQLGLESRLGEKGIAGITWEKGWGKNSDGKGGFGFVITIPGQKTDSGKTIGLRFDMDALPILEQTNLPYKSCHKGVMHACGHDGHMAIGATVAHYFTKPENRKFNGTLKLIFQPAEEGRGGAKAMICEGLFERHRMDSVYALHNWPELPVGKIAVHSGPVMASSDYFNIVVKGKGGHAALPHLVKSPLQCGSRIAECMDNLGQTLKQPPHNISGPFLVAVTRSEFGHKDRPRIIDDNHYIDVTTGSYSEADRAAIKDRIIAEAREIALAAGMEIEINYREGSAPTVNDAGEATLCIEAAINTAGSWNVITDMLPSYAAEDFGAMLGKVPGCYVWLGQGEPENPHSPHNRALHNNGYDFNDRIIPIGAEYLVRVVERKLEL